MSCHQSALMYDLSRYECPFPLHGPTPTHCIKDEKLPFNIICSSAGVLKRVVVDASKCSLNYLTSNLYTFCAIESAPARMILPAKSTLPR